MHHALTNPFLCSHRCEDLHRVGENVVQIESNHLKLHLAVLQLGSIKHVIYENL